MKREMFLMTVFSVIGLVLLLVFTPVTSLTQEEKSGTQESSKVCSACHADQVKAFELNRHFVLDSKGFAKKAGADFSCASCHGDTADHLKQPGKGTIFAFDAEDPAGVKTQRCQTCHDDTHPRFSLSPHAKAGLDCTSCHSVHADSDSKKDSLVLTERVSGTCYTCHSDTFAKFNLNERHRLKEGILECTSCHASRTVNSPPPGRL
jgi:predicted CXXCH cytochrome family protein